MDIIFPRRLLSKDLYTSESFDCYEAFGNGAFQRRQMILCSLAYFLVRIHGLAIQLISRDVEHWCKQPEANISEIVWRNPAVPVGAEGRLSRCHLYKHSGDPNNTELATCQEWEYSDEEARTSIVSEWNLVCERRLLKVAIILVYHAGAFFSLAAAGTIADSIGRKPVLLAGGALLIVSTVAGCLSSTFVMQVAMRFLSSGSVNVVMSLSSVSFFEITTHENRPLHVAVFSAAGILFASMYYISFAPLKLWWRLKEAIFLLPTVLLLPFFCIVCESPRWLISKARVERAEAVMLAAAELNQFPYAHTASMVHQLTADIAANAQRLPAIDEDVLGGCSVLRRVLIMCASSFSIMFTMFNVIYSPFQQEELWFKFAMFALSAVACALLYPMLRMVTMLTLLRMYFAVLGTLQCLLSLAAGAEIKFAIVAVIVVSKASFLPGAVLSFTYTLELLPTAVRATAICWAYACGRFGMLTALAAVALQNIGRVDLAYAIAGLLLFASMIAQRGLPRATCVECAKETATRHTAISQRSVEHMKKSLECRAEDATRSKANSESRSSVSSRGRLREGYSHDS